MPHLSLHAHSRTRFTRVPQDLGLLGRDLSQTIIVDNSPDAYAWHPENAIACTSW